MSFKKPYFAIAVVGLALASGAAWWLQNKPAGTTAEVSAAANPSAAPGQPAFRAVAHPGFLGLGGHRQP